MIVHTSIESREFAAIYSPAHLAASQGREHGDVVAPVGYVAPPAATGNRTRGRFSSRTTSSWLSARAVDCSVGSRSCSPVSASSGRAAATARAARWRSAAGGVVIAQEATLPFFGMPSDALKGRGRFRSPSRELALAR